MSQTQQFDDKSAREFLTEFLKQPVGEYLIGLVRQYITEQRTSRIELLEQLQHRTDFTDLRLDAVVQYTHSEIAGEEILDIILGAATISDE
jgi:hypothetical protein